MPSEVQPVLHEPKKYITYLEDEDTDLSGTVVENSDNVPTCARMSQLTDRSTCFIRHSRERNKTQTLAYQEFFIQAAEIDNNVQLL